MSEYALVRSTTAGSEVKFESAYPPCRTKPNLRHPTLPPEVANATTPKPTDIANKNAPSAEPAAHIRQHMVGKEEERIERPPHFAHPGV